MFRKIALAVGGKALAHWLSDAFAGKKGPAAQKLLTVGMGHVTETSFLFGCVLIPALLASGYEEAAAVVAMLAGAGVSAGLIRKNYLTEVPEEVLGSAWYAFLRNHAADVAAIFAAAAAAVQVCEPSTAAMLARVHLTCGSAGMVLAIIAAVWGHLGLSAAAKLAVPKKGEQG